MGLLEQVIGGILLLAIAGLFWVRHHANESVVAMRRAWNDYWLWKHVESKRQYAELQRLKRVHWEKGTFASEEHLAQAERILDDHQAEGRKQLRQMSRDIDDARRRRLRRVDHVFLILTHPGASFGERMRGLWRSFTTKPFSLEETLDRVLQMDGEGKLEQFLEDLDQDDSTRTES